MVQGCLNFTPIPATEICDFKTTDLFILQQYPETCVSLDKFTSGAGHTVWTPQLFKRWSTTVDRPALYVIFPPTPDLSTPYI